MLPKISEAVKKYGKGLGEKKALVYRTDVDKLNGEALEEIEDEDIKDVLEKKVNS